MSAYKLSAKATKLITLARSIQQKSNQLSSLVLAFKKRILQKEKETELYNLKTEINSLQVEADKIWIELKSSQPAELNNLLLHLKACLQKVWENFRKKGFPSELPCGEFNSRTIPEILNILERLIAGDESVKNRYWALAVADQFCKSKKRA